MRIAEVGASNFYGMAEQINFRSHETLIDFEAAIIDLSCINDNYENLIKGKTINEDLSREIINDISRRDEQIKILMNLVRYLFFLRAGTYRMFFTRLWSY